MPLVAPAAGSPGEGRLRSTRPVGDPRSPFAFESRSARVRVQGLEEPLRSSAAVRERVDRSSHVAITALRRPDRKGSVCRRDPLQSLAQPHQVGPTPGIETHLELVPSRSAPRPCDGAIAIQQTSNDMRHQFGRHLQRTDRSALAGMNTDRSRPFEHGDAAGIRFEADVPVSMPFADSTRELKTVDEGLDQYLVLRSETNVAGLTASPRRHPAIGRQESHPIRELSAPWNRAHDGAAPATPSALRGWCPSRVRQAAMASGGSCDPLIRCRSKSARPASSHQGNLNHRCQPVNGTSDADG